MSPNYPHKGLMNAIYVWALRLSNDPNLLRHESIYLERACSALSNVASTVHDSLNVSACYSASGKKQRQLTFIV